MECRINRIWIQSGYETNVNVRCKGGLGLVSMEKRRSWAFLLCSRAESQPSLLVPVTEGYCCKGATALVSEHSCALVPKTETLKATVRRERTNRFKITRCGKHGEEQGGGNISAYYSVTFSSRMLSRSSKSSPANIFVFMHADAHAEYLHLITRARAQRHRFS